jgi:short subunit dehydrogenase-like uncharacterized protein
VDTGYFITGSGVSGMSGGTKASLAGVINAPSFGWRDGAIRSERGAARYRTFRLRDKDRPGVSVGSSEHYALPRFHPGLREVNAYLGWFGPASRAMQASSLVGSLAFKLPGVENVWGAATDRFVKGSTGGPDAGERAQGGSHIVGEAFDAGGNRLAEVHLTGVDGYTFTGDILAWGAERAANGGLKGVGALGPVDGFGLEALEAGAAEAGIRRL